MNRPRLVTVAHGTRVAVGNRVARAVTGLAGRRLGVPAHTSYVELCRPMLADALVEEPGPSIVVPLLLSTGHHARHDLPASVARAPQPVVLAGPLGPHPLLAEVLVRRLLGAGARADEPVVLTAAGSNDPAAMADLTAAAHLLDRRWDAPVRLATLTGPGPGLEEVIAEARRDGRVAVAPYLLATGHFHKQTLIRAGAAGAHLVSGVIGADPLVAELVTRRYLAAANLHVLRREQAVVAARTGSC